LCRSSTNIVSENGAVLRHESCDQFNRSKRRETLRKALGSTRSIENGASSKNLVTIERSKGAERSLSRLRAVEHSLATPDYAPATAREPRAAPSTPQDPHVPSEPPAPSANHALTRTRNKLRSMALSLT